MRYRGGRIVVVGLATSNASRTGQIVVVVDVAVGAGSRRHRVQSGKGEAGAVVIERGIQPGAGAMALLTGLREVRSHVVWIGRALIVLEMAAHAGRCVEAVVVVNVTICASARWYRVQAGQREARVVMVEGCVHPVRGVVALLAGLREIRGDVVGIGGALVVL